MLPVNGLYGHIQRNVFKSLLLLIAFFGLVVVFWGSWCVIYAAIVDYWRFTPKHGHALTVASILSHGLEIAWNNAWAAPVGTLIWFANAYAFHDDIIDAATGAFPVTRKDNPRLYNLVENLAMTAGLPMPRVEIMPTPELNAYASGKSPSSASVAVTQGLLDALSEDELEAVLAHEITHIVNRDVSFMAVATVFVGGLTLVGDWVGRWFSNGPSISDGYDVTRPVRSSSSGDSVDSESAAAFVAAAVSILIAVALLALVHGLAIVIRLAISRSREYMADAGSAELTKQPEALISALRKIEGNSEIPGLAPNVAAMMIGGRTGWFDTHPATEDRVAALFAFCGARPELVRKRAAEGAPRRVFGKRGAAPA